MPGDPDRAAAGDFEAALTAFKAFHALDVEMRDQRREAHARTLQAVFETSEARRESERHRELSSRDPLTGLRNRRFLDEGLAATLTLAAEAGQTLTIAFMDLDHFKHINDTHSRDVGDEVLRGVAALLERAPVAVAARMGGEEFLLALVDVEPADAVARLESVRAAIAAARSASGESAGAGRLVLVGRSRVARSAVTRDRAARDPAGRQRGGSSEHPFNCGVWTAARARRAWSTAPH